MRPPDGRRAGAARGARGVGEYLGQPLTRLRFARARSVGNALERASLRQANHLVNPSPGRLRSKADLVTVEADDITQSWVFQAEG